jgi:hypothetical protein
MVASDALYQIRFLPLKSSLANLPPKLYTSLVAAQKVRTPPLSTAPD